MVFLFKKLIFCLIAFLPLIGLAQPIQFTIDSIPKVNGRVEFNVDFKFNLTKEEFHKRVYYYLNHKLNPYSARILKDNNNFTVCKTTNYIGILDGLFQKFGMYMTYSLQLEYKDGICSMIIRDIYFMEKGYFEADIDNKRKQAIPKYSAKDIMIDQKYSLMLIRNASERITKESLQRINEIIKALFISFKNKAT